MGADTRGDLGSILGIWAHPDDEAWLSAGLMMKAVEAGYGVTCLTATRGEAGFPADDPRSVSERTAIRETEMATCLSILGVTDHRWLGYGDGQCAQVPDEDVAADLAETIAELRPDTVLTFGPDGATGHPDHIAVCRWTTSAVQLAGLSDTRLLYATKTHDWRDEFFAGVDPATVMMVEGMEPEAVEESELAVWFSCDERLLPRKVAALRAQVSQIESIAVATGPDLFAALVRDEFFRAPLPTDTELIDRMTNALEARSSGHKDPSPTDVEASIPAGILGLCLDAIDPGIRGPDPAPAAHRVNGFRAHLRKPPPHCHRPRCAPTRRRQVAKPPAGSCHGRTPLAPGRTPGPAVESARSPVPPLPTRIHRPTPRRFGDASVLAEGR